MGKVLQKINLYLKGRNKMKKTLLAFALVASLILSLTACKSNEPLNNQNADLESSDTNSNFNNNDSDTSSKHAKSWLDLFDGKQKVWFLVTENELSYDSVVSAVFVTENKKVTKAYYCNRNAKNINPEIPEYNSDLWKLSDFDSLRDDEILEKVNSSYFDASVTYTLDAFNVSAGATEQLTYEKNDFPYTIQYTGELDNSGNNLEDEELKLLEHFREKNLRFSIESSVKPTEIKSEQYSGISGYTWDGNGLHYIVTKAKLGDLSNIGNDDASGITEW